MFEKFSLTSRNSIILLICVFGLITPFTLFAVYSARSGIDRIQDEKCNELLATVESSSPSQSEFTSEAYMTAAIDGIQTLDKNIVEVAVLKLNSGKLAPYVSTLTNSITTEAIDSGLETFAHSRSDKNVFYRDGIEHVYLTSPILVDNKIVGIYKVVVSLEESHAQKTTLTFQLLAAGFLAGLLLFYVIGRFIMQKITLQIDNQKEVVAAIENDDFEPGMVLDENEELVSLSKIYADKSSELENIRTRLDMRTQELEQEIEAREALGSQLHEAERLDAIGRLAGGVAHDFNNQLTVISGYAGLLRGKISEDQRQEFSKLISSSAASAADLTGQLLTFARRGQYNWSTMDVHEVLEETAAMLHRSVKKSVRIHTHLYAENSFVVGDPKKLQNAFLNLGINAADAMEQSGELTFYSHVIPANESPLADAMNQAHGVLCVEVRDTGPGIPDNVMKQMFEPFFTTKGLGKGTGLGLSVVYGTVKDHGGIVIAENRKTCTALSVFLPLSEDSVTPTAIEEEPYTPVYSDLHILIVDDEKPVREVLSDVVTHLGHEATVATNGIEAIRHFKNVGETIDIVLMDIMMPEMDGAETFRMLNEIDSSVLTIFISGYPVEQQLVSIPNILNTSLLQKPFSPEDLSKAIDDLLKTAGREGSKSASLPLL